MIVPGEGLPLIVVACCRVVCAGGALHFTCRLAWAAALERLERPVIYGDGTTTRDFVSVKDVVRAIRLAAETENEACFGEAFNIAAGHSTSLNGLFELLRAEAARKNPEAARIEPRYADFRPGDIRHSTADISKARNLLGFEPEISLAEGLATLILDRY